MPQCKRLRAANEQSLGFEVFPAKWATNNSTNWLPDETVDAFKELCVGIKAPVKTPVGGGTVRSTFACARWLEPICLACAPCHGSKGSSPVKHPEKVEMVVSFRGRHGRHLGAFESAAGTAGSAEGPRFIAKEVSNEVRENPFGTKSQKPGILESVGARISDRRQSRHRRQARQFSGQRALASQPP